MLTDGEALLLGPTRESRRESFVADDAAPAAYGNRRKYSAGRWTLMSYALFFLRTSILFLYKSLPMQIENFLILSTSLSISS